MSNNSCPCPTGGEIGRAQAAQAEACRLAPETDMNPILLKPTSDTAGQVVVQGKVWRDLSGAEYYAQHDVLAERVAESFERLSAKYDFVVAEGAGSVAEVNLRPVDLTNFGLASRFKIPVLLVADIDRGGALASVYGTLKLPAPSDAALIRAFAFNRFRGDRALLDDGVTLLERRVARPCLGVFPWANDIHLDEEDGPLGPQPAAPPDAPRIAILRFPRISNLTDFRLFPWARWVIRPLAEPFDIIILPGTKNTLADLAWLRAAGLDNWLKQQHRRGAILFGVCGGYQMLGEEISDPHGVESAGQAAPGLGLLPVKTVLGAEKTTLAVRARTGQGVEFDAYEIHMGNTVRPADAVPLAYVGARPDGVRLDRCMGGYLHGALENPVVVEEWLQFKPPAAPHREESFERLADWFEASADTALFEKLFL